VPSSQECPVPKAYCDSRVHTLQADARSLAADQLLAHTHAPSQAHPGFNAVLSDMCHSTLGVAAADVARSLELAQTAATMALGDLGVRASRQPGARRAWRLVLYAALAPL
jgi:23S rRNA U2552 (ribose-2'-O)-methylase RlmE/FtsJ